jgi:hypothetical protein
LEIMKNAPIHLADVLFEIIVNTPSI